MSNKTITQFTVPAYQVIIVIVQNDVPSQISKLESPHNCNAELQGRITGSAQAIANNDLAYSSCTTLMLQEVDLTFARHICLDMPRYLVEIQQGNTGNISH